MAILEMMMPSYAAVGNITFLNIGALGSSAAAITLGQPATPAVNDIWIMVVQTSNQAITTPTNATAGTWAEIATQNGTGTAGTAGARRLGFFWHRWTTATGNITVADSGDHQIARIAAYRGVRTTGNPWNVVGTCQTASYTTIPVNVTGLVTTVNNVRYVYAMAHNEDIADTPRATVSGSSPYTDIQERFDNTLSTGTGGGIVLADALRATAGAGSANFGIALTTNPTGVVKCEVALEPA